MFTHGLSESPEYAVWAQAKARCENPSHKQYRHYGGRGISMAKEWSESFASFIAYVGLRPTEEHSIDRWPNNDGNYEPGNVRWTTTDQQNRNKRSNHWIEFGGKRQTVTDWAKELGIKEPSLIRRLKIHPVELALTPGYFKKRNSSTPPPNHCIKGHEFTTENSMRTVSRGVVGRRCRECSTVGQRSRWRKTKRFKQEQAK